MRSACRRKSTTALGTACLLVDASRQWHSECMNALSTAVDSGSERVNCTVSISYTCMSTCMCKMLYDYRKAHNERESEDSFRTVFLLQSSVNLRNNGMGTT